MATARDYADIFRMLIDERNKCVIPDNIKLKIIRVLNDSKSLESELSRESRIVNEIIKGDI